MKLLHNILRGSTLATALFIFQACYGMPPSDFENRAFYEATIKVTDSDGTPMQGVQLFAKNAEMAEFISTEVSDKDGLLHFSISVPRENPEIAMRFEAEGFEARETTITDVFNPEPDFAVELEALK